MAYLLQHEPDVWHWANQRSTKEEQLDAARAALLRNTYRMEPQAHPDTHAILGEAMDRLGMTGMPVTLYQSHGTELNASLAFIPGEIHVVFHGAVLERLARDELLALLGHELAHHLLWSRDDGRYLAAERILSDAVAAPGARDSHRETWRRYALNTELFADRGAAVAANGVEAAVSTLVKMETGISTVDAAAYLRQSDEVETRESAASGAYSHPESTIRARALGMWWQGADDLDPWIEARLSGKLALDRLYLPGQVRMQSLTRRFIAYFLSGSALASDAVMAQVRLIFPDWSDDEPVIDVATLSAEITEANIRQFFNALMIDLALADPDQQHAALLHAGMVATALGSVDDLAVNLRRDAGFGKRELDRYKRELAKEVAK
ncbi:M48 family metalloprotease [Luteibacter sp.]|uniref:M48 family metalloprotease n=1 Tax=Luteibacter sp. TaxID=1886636 RepID=UPI003F7CE6D4